MFSNERYDKIIELLSEKDSVSVGELRDLFGVSIETIRKDLSFLEGQKCLKRIHGGALSLRVNHSYEAIDTRATENIELKKELAKKAVEFIENGDIIAIDSGSTAIELAKQLKDKFTDLTLITHALDVLNILKGTKGFQIIFVGGVYMASENAFVGNIAVDMIKGLYASKAFIFPSAIIADKGVYIKEIEMLPIEKAYMSIAEEIFILADSKKYKAIGKVKLCDLNKDHTFITDSSLSIHTKKALEKSKIRIFN